MANLTPPWSSGWPPSSEVANRRRLDPALLGHPRQHLTIGLAIVAAHDRPQRGVGLANNAKTPQIWAAKGGYPANAGYTMASACRRSDGLLCMETRQCQADPSNSMSITYWTPAITRKGQSGRLVSTSVRNVATHSRLVQSRQSGQRYRITAGPWRSLGPGTRRSGNSMTP